MPTRSDLQKEFAPNADKLRRKYLKELADLTGRDTILYCSAFTSKRVPNLPGYVLSVTVEDVQGFMAALCGLSGEKLDLVLHSPGGSIEAAEQIMQYLRSKYKHIRAIIPQNAMSAATMMACACDEIMMGRQSALGPIDPQITLPTANGQMSVAAQSVIDDFILAQQSIAQNPKTAPLWAAKMKDYPPGLLTSCERSLALSVEKVTSWLSSYMFAGEADAHQKATSIAQWLGDAKMHKTHGRPIGIVQAQQIQLKVKPMDGVEGDQKLQDAILSVFHAAAITFENSNCVKITENHNGKGWFVNANPSAQKP